MIVEIGHFALVLALCAAIAQTIVPSWGARLGDPALMAVGQSAALTQLALVAIAFAALVDAHLTSDFSVLNVAENSHSAVPTIYKISGVWGNHEGSMLLWVLILAIFGAAGVVCSADRCRARCARTRSPCRASSASPSCSSSF